MASRQVVVSVCDRCTIEASEPLSRKNRHHSDLLLPKGWLHVSGNTAGTTVFELDLCPECAQIVIESAGKARVAHSTSSSKAKTKPEKAEADKTEKAEVANTERQHGEEQGKNEKKSKTLAAAG